MPNSNTFGIKPIKDIIDKYGFTDKSKKYLDPFCRNSPYKNNCVSNDIDPDIVADYHMDAIDFLKMFDTGSIDGVLFDPPYSTRQVSECYKKMDKTVNMETTQSSFWGNLKKQISRILIFDGICVSCGWNSGGIGIKNGFDIIEILLVPHGGWHNDTIVTVEKKRIQQAELF
jgi:hypothetical protein